MVLHIGMERAGAISNICMPPARKTRWQYNINYFCDIQAKFERLALEKMLHIFGLFALYYQIFLYLVLFSNYFLVQTQEKYYC